MKQQPLTGLLLYVASLSLLAKQAKKTWEQEMWQPYAWELQDKGPSFYQILPTRGTNAYVNFNNFQTHMSRRERITPIVLHMGYVAPNRKIALFKCSQTWLTKDNLGCSGLVVPGARALCHSPYVA